MPLFFGIDAVHGHCQHPGATVFPTQLAAACARDRDLVREMGRATAREAAADGALWNFSPVLAHVCRGAQALGGANPLADYLVENTVAQAERYAASTAWSRVIWDVTAVGWLLDDAGAAMRDRLISSPIPQYDGAYAFDDARHPIRYV